MICFLWLKTNDTESDVKHREWTSEISILWVVFPGNIHYHTCWWTNDQGKANHFTACLKTENFQCSKGGISIPKQEMTLASTKCQVIILCSELAVYIHISWFQFNFVHCRCTTNSGQTFACKGQKLVSSWLEYKRLSRYEKTFNLYIQIMLHTLRILNILCYSHITMITTKKKNKYICACINILKSSCHIVIYIIRS
jgi:hypothetical protein